MDIFLTIFGCNGTAVNRLTLANVIGRAGTNGKAVADKTFVGGGFKR